MILAGRYSAARWTLLMLVGWGFVSVTRADEANEAFFEKKIRPVLAEHCYECHQGERADVEGELQVDSLEGLLRGGTRGPAIVPGKPQESLLVLAIQHADQLNMPPRRKLAADQIQDFVRWIEQGAAWPGATAIPSSPDSQSKSPETANSSTNTAEEEPLWSLLPPQPQSLPRIQDRHWAQRPVDYFILSRLEQAGLQPAPRAARRTWLRRVTFDLTGLPPTPAEARAFERDTSADAEARVVDRLLASPRYGERWGRHWLDIVRYADSNGMDENLAYANAWRYRDYVIRSWNADKPFDHFVCEQLAGDLMPIDDPIAARDARIATGFLSLGAKMLAEDDPVKMQMDIVDEQVDTMGRALMGMTLGCARCHDHKFDPLSTHDYYGLAGIFKSTQTMETYTVVAKWREESIADAELTARHQELTQQIAQLPAESEQAKQLKASLPELPTAMIVSEGEPQNVKVHIRGSHVSLGDLVERGFPRAILSGEDWRIPEARSGRLELAQWLTDSRHPLTARVIVNRVWQYHFGEGLVRSPDNFGRLGERPTHPELLDYLALQLIDNGWSLKRLHRELLLSSTYAMNAQYNGAAFEQDPENRLLWRMPRRRLEVEAIRDSLLFVSGQLDWRMGGTQLTTPNRQYVTSTANVNPVVYDGTRRSIYLPVVRSALFELFQAFDFADPSVQAGRRDATTVAPQALFMMNSSLVTDQMKRWSQSLLDRTDWTDEQRIATIYETAYGRLPTEAETARAMRYLARFMSNETSVRAAEAAQRPTAHLAWESLCRALVSASEFIYVE